jgi:hypothetical protein
MKYYDLEKFREKQDLVGCGVDDALRMSHGCEEVILRLRLQPKRRLGLTVSLKDLDLAKELFESTARRKSNVQ